MQCAGTLCRYTSPPSPALTASLASPSRGEQDPEDLCTMVYQGGASPPSPNPWRKDGDDGNSPPGSPLSPARSPLLAGDATKNGLAWLAANLRVLMEVDVGCASDAEAENQIVQRAR